MRTTIIFLLLFLLFIPFYCTNDSSVPNKPNFIYNAQDTSGEGDLPCCNNRNPFEGPPDGICPSDDALVSLACNNGGVKFEKIITCACCKAMWQKFGEYPYWYNIPCASIGGPSGLYCTETWKN